MLDLTRAYVGAPGDVICSITLRDRSLIVGRSLYSSVTRIYRTQAYPSGDTVVLLNARTLLVERILALWEVFPSLHDAGHTISNLVVDSGLKLVGWIDPTHLASLKMPVRLLHRLVNI